MTQLDPQTSEWIVEKEKLHRVSNFLGKEDLTCFPNWHDSQSKFLMCLRLGTIIFNLDKLGWPKQSCKSFGDEVAKQNIEELGFRK